MPLLPTEAQPAPEAAQLANRLLLAVGLPAWETSLGVLLACALVAFGVTQAIKTRTDAQGRRGTDAQGQDLRRWQWAWRVVPTLAGVLTGQLFAALGTAHWAACLILGLLGGLFAVQLFHGLKGLVPGLSNLER